MAATEWTDRAVRGPHLEYLTDVQFAGLFGFSVDTLDRLVESGEVPQPIELTKRTKVWTAEDVIYYSLRVRLKERFIGAQRGQKGA